MANLEQSDTSLASELGLKDKGVCQMSVINS